MLFVGGVSVGKSITLPTLGVITQADLERAQAEQRAKGKKGVFIRTLGCQMNEHDSEIILGMLCKAGYEPVDNLLAAQLIIFNTCAVRENPERKLYGQMDMLRSLKELNPAVILGICGCMMQQPSALQRIQEAYEHVDLVFGTHNLHRLPELLHRVEAGERVIEIWDEPGPIVEGLPVLRASTLKTYITIMYGCNQFCTYCIVPYVRGKERSRLPSAILAEAQEAIAQGSKEIMLLGQNVNAYGCDLEEGISFAELLRQMDALPNMGRIRFTSPHPKYMGDDVISAIAECKSVCEHVHLPVQAGSDRILRRMGRRYTRAEYVRLVEKLRSAVPGLALSTDLIVGFPGETEEDFRETLSLVEEIGFDSAFMFIYSPRKGTPATRLPGEIPEETKRERINRLIELQNSISLAKNRELIGQEMEVLVDGVGKEPGTMAGRTRTNKLVIFAGEPSELGTLRRVRIDAANTFGLEGTGV
ncbi:MAG: tRNA (N6-isopentenyl adenosine(37)-C2)-methylthiotransferase MiaB [Firmicutes bacterium]|jgi:tRNA-2-methylthio-N6-dimethylallyladenosine synthase|nr:tRNA (N6-isopentenyl adenosine(37)-C2)-methylthiotransferase MiaB [Bacillota bacterium]